MEEKRPYIGRMLSANSRECVMSSLVPQNELPPFGSMLRIPLGTTPEIQIYAVVTDITLEDDGFLRQIAGSASISEEVIRDARENRNVPIVLRAAFIGKGHVILADEHGLVVLLCLTMADQDDPFAR